MCMCMTLKKAIWGERQQYCGETMLQPTELNLHPNTISSSYTFGGVSLSYFE